jgi:hypothetical protein
MEKSFFTAPCDPPARVQNESGAKEAPSNMSRQPHRRPCCTKIGLDLSWSKCNLDSVTSTGAGSMKAIVMTAARAIFSAASNFLGI